MATNPRISDLAVELELSEPDVMAACDLLGIVYRSSHTRVSDAQAERVRQRVDRAKSSPVGDRFDVSATPQGSPGGLAPPTGPVASSTPPRAIGSVLRSTAIEPEPSKGVID